MSAAQAPGRDLPSEIEVTVCQEITSHEKRDKESGRPKRLRPGEDVKMPRALALRLAGMSKPRVLIDRDERTAYKKALADAAAEAEKQQKAASKKADKAGASE